MLITEALSWAFLKLKEKSLGNPHLEAEILLSAILNTPRELILSHPEKKLSALQIKNFQLHIHRRLRGIPSAYLTGEKEFYGLKFFVNRNVLIPRPETEMMVEETLKIINYELQIKNSKFNIIDVGTGSGCIIIAIFKHLQSGSKFHVSSFNFAGIDVSRKALEVARKNARLYQTSSQIKFLQGDLLGPILKSKIINPNSKIIILANLPYLTPAQIKNSPSIKYEPKLALSAGPDGLKYYRKLFKQLKFSQVSSFQFQVLCEIDPSQTANIKKLIKHEIPGWQSEIKKDLRGHNRLVKLTNT